MAGQTNAGLRNTIDAAKAAVLPTIIIKEEDRAPLKNWQSKRKIPIHVWHAFFDDAFGISFSAAEKLFARGDIAPTEQVFQAPGGATTKKVIYKIYYRYAYLYLSWIRSSKRTCPKHRHTNSLGLDMKGKPYARGASSGRRIGRRTSWRPMCCRRSHHVCLTPR